MPKDWIGNASFRACNTRSKDAEENDYYATEPKATELLLELEQFSPYIWEPACGEGHISKVLEEHGHTVVSTDLIDRGFGTGDVDFLKQTLSFDGDIILRTSMRRSLLRRLLNLSLPEERWLCSSSSHFSKGKTAESCSVIPPLKQFMFLPQDYNAERTECLKVVQWLLMRGLYGRKVTMDLHT